MGAHIRLVSSEAEERAGLDGEAIAVDEAPVGLPEEAGADKGRPAESRRDEMLGEAAPPLVAEPEDRAGGPGGRERPKGALARLIAFAGPRRRDPRRRLWRPGVKRCSEKGRCRLSPSRRIARAVWVGASVRKALWQGSSPSPVHGRRKPRRRSWKRRAPKPSPNPRRLWASGGTRTRGQTRLSSRPPGRRRSRTGRKWASGARGQQRRAKPRRPLFARKGAIAVVLMTGVAAAAIVVLNWPHGSPPQARGAGHARGSADEGDGAVRRRWRRFRRGKSQMSLASGRRCMRPGETRSRRSCRSKTRSRPHPRLRGLRPQPFPRSAHLSL